MTSALDFKVRMDPSWWSALQSNPFDPHICILWKYEVKKTRWVEYWFESDLYHNCLHTHFLEWRRHRWKRCCVHCARSLSETVKKLSRGNFRVVQSSVKYALEISWSKTGVFSTAPCVILLMLLCQE